MPALGFMVETRAEVTRDFIPLNLAKLCIDCETIFAGESCPRCGATKGALSLSPILNRREAA